MANIELKCDNCGISFHRTRSYVNGKNKRGNKSFYCSKECSTKGVGKSVSNTWKERRDTAVKLSSNKCLFCEKQIAENIMFCDFDCYNDYRHENGTKLVECFSCGKEFRKDMGQIKRGEKHHYCSRKCLGAGNTKLGTTIVACSGCGEDIIKHNNTIRRWSNTYCSKECHDRHMNKNMKKRYRSKLELFLKEKLTEKYPHVKILYNHRKLLGGLELDIYFPEYKLAIEINGPYHYKPVYGVERLEVIQKRDKEKIEKCKEHNVTLIIMDNLERFSEKLGNEYLLKFDDILNKYS